MLQQWLAMPEHGGTGLLLALVAIFFVALGATLLIGAVLALLTTNLGFGKAALLTFGVLSGYLVMHSISWILTGKGPPLNSTTTTYWGTRIEGAGIGLVALIVFLVIALLWHRSERAAQHVSEE